MKHVLLSFALAALLACDAIGPSGNSVAGTWGFTNGKTSRYEMTLSQKDGAISGTVCAYAFGGPIAPAQERGVSGRYPKLQFLDPLGPACIFDATFEDDRDQISGDCRPGGELVRFTRGGSGRCLRTAAGGPAP